MAKRSPVAPSDMLLFVDVVRDGSFTAAAARNGISKQAVSERIARLEAALGVRLLQRTTRRVRATDAGERYFNECAAISQHIDQANRSIQTEQDEPVGLLRVSAPMVYGRGQLMNAIRTYTRRHPRVQVDLQLVDRLVNLVEEGVDVALRVSHLSDGTLRARRLGQVSAYFVASPELLETRGAQSDLQFIASAPAITFREGEVWDLPNGTKIKPKMALNANDLASIATATALGIGVARLPGILCKPMIARGELQMLLRGQPATTFSVHAVYPSSKQLGPKIRHFVDALVQHRADLTESDAGAAPSL